LKEIKKMAIQNVLVPDIGEYSDVEIIEISVAEGDVVEVEQ
jgi:pyruvate/2-oxoglutarate dehydrogenase complex dihydrolipoamide acyltransferase (E2) component